MNKTPVALIIFDGFGHNDSNEHNAIAQAKMPNWDALKNNYPNTLINASESFVGLPKGQMGNSEVGHLNIGSGRVIHQDLERINLSIENGSFFNNQLLVDAIEKTMSEDKSLHIFGLLSDGGVHSHIGHFDALLKYLASKNLKKVFIHAFLDGRDTPPKSAEKYLKHIESTCKQFGCGEVASISGRFYSMDRDKRWDRTQQAYELLTEGVAEFSSNTSLDALNMAYDRGENDEFVKPTKINTKKNSLLADGDTVVFINFRSDRARQISDALLNDDFEGFHRNKIIRNLNYLTLTLYDQKQKKAKPLFLPIEVKNSLGEIMEKTGRTQLRIAETEKYPHVTFFFNGGDEKVFDGEDRILIPSPKVSTYDLKPEMSAFELTEKLIEAIESKKYDLIICNFANGDMVGHTGDLNAAIKAVEALDQCIGKIADAIKKVDGHMIVTADHGNAEQMMDNINNQTHTQHTTNLVPFLYMGRNASLKKEGKLSDIAPSILTIMNESIPNEMTGENLITFND